MSAFVKRMPATGVLRGARRGCNAGVHSICAARSGDAFWSRYGNRDPEPIGCMALRELGSTRDGRLRKPDAEGVAGRHLHGPRPAGSRPAPPGTSAGFSYAEGEAPWDGWSVRL